MKVLNYGSMNIDNVYSVPHMVAPGETLLARGKQLFCGGKGLNQSIAMSKAGCEVYHAGVAGSDGQMLLDALQKYGVHTGCIKRVPGPSGHTVIQVDGNAQNSIIVYADETITFTDAELDAVLQDFGPGDALVEQNELSRSPEMMRKAADRGLTIIFNPSPANEEIQKYPLDRVDWFIMNEIEGNMLTGETEPERILDAMAQKYPCASVLLTLGADGAYLRRAGQTFFQPSFKVDAVDTTAAGDTFSGYFISGLAAGEDMPTALRRAAYAASVAVSRKGAADSIPVRDEIDF